jgi:hypothetical protein
VVIIIAVIAIVIVAVLALSGSLSTNQVKIVVHSSGSWSLGYGDQGGINTATGSGDREFVLTKSTSGQWSVAASAIKMDMSAAQLTVTIEKMDGSVLKSSSTTTYFGMATVSINL